MIHSMSGAVADLLMTSTLNKMKVMMTMMVATMRTTPMIRTKSVSSMAVAHHGRLSSRGQVKCTAWNHNECVVLEGFERSTLSNSEPPSQPHAHQNCIHQI